MLEPKEFGSHLCSLGDSKMSCKFRAQFHSWATARNTCVHNHPVQSNATRIGGPKHTCLRWSKLEFVPSKTLDSSLGSLASVCSISRGILIRRTLCYRAKDAEFGHRCSHLLAVDEPKKYHSAWLRFDLFHSTSPGTHVYLSKLFCFPQDLC
jgi:hypothetical protein